jgi:GLPGLI family protein
MILEINKNSNNIINEFVFNLDISNNKSYFSLVDKLYSDDEAKKFGLLKLSYIGENIQSNDSVFKVFNFGDKTRLVGNKKNIDWKTTTETKTISGYVCYKATLTDIIINSKGTFNFPVTAWYCPELPYSYGPLHFGGLPGLIVELQTKDGVFGLSSYKIISNHEIIKKITNDTIISEEKAKDIIIEKQKNE